MKIVLDTNVIVSGLNFPGNERIVLELALRGRFESFLSPFILQEVADVLVGVRNGRPKASECSGIQPLLSNPGDSQK